MSAATYQQYLERGYRRFGLLYFRPRCAGCRECVPYRVIVDEFHPRKDMRRCWKKNSEIRYEVALPEVTQEKIDMYNAYHEFQTDNVGWRHQQTTANDYFETFAIPCATAREFRYYHGERLVGVGYVDEVDNALSSIYFIHAPEYRKSGLGMLSVLAEIDWAQKNGKKYVYLGYYIRECPSMSYKGRYRPCEVLLGIPKEGEKPHWQRWS